MNIKYYIKNPLEIGVQLLCRYGKKIPDDRYLRILFFLRMHRRLNLNCPQTFSEKLQWLKLYDRNPEYTKMVDKYAVKDYVSKVLGPEYVIPTIGVWDSPEAIEWDKLPNKFVLKTTHGGGGTGVIICKDKNKLDKGAVINSLNKSLAIDIYAMLKEWPYKNVPRRIIAEEYVEPQQNLKGLQDYKFFCFNGDVKCLFVATDRQNPNEEVKFDFFDADYNHLSLKQGHRNALHVPIKPINFDLMKNTAALLSRGFPHVRVDLYDTGDRVLFGELTFFHNSGLVPFQPKMWDKKMGDMLTLPKKSYGC